MKQENTLDRRVRRTKQTFIKSYIQLIKEKGYAKVSVTDIVERADYNRATFYAHFNNKEDLTHEIVEKMSDELQKAFLLNLSVPGYLDIDNFSSSSVKVFHYIHQNSDLFDLLKEPDSIPGLLDKTIQTIRSFHEEIILVGEQALDINDTSFITYRTYGDLGIILEWIKSDYTLSPEEISKQSLDILKADYPKTKMSVNS
ncbi:TetR/AcrR family transcriptional regulator [Oceanobacillus sp. CAU 1775]